MGGQLGDGSASHQRIAIRPGGPESIRSCADGRPAHQPGTHDPARRGAASRWSPTGPARPAPGAARSRRGPLR
ncbi:hypothetical protein E0F15_00940 [Frankia sp. B2]|nr:hypothetical protein E0F15_00940 [Frankia sp. B2]